MMNQVEINKTNKLTKGHRGGKRKGAGRPKLGRDKLLTVRLSPRTIALLGRRPALRVRELIEKMVGGGEKSAPGDVIVIRSGRGERPTLQSILERL